MKQLKVVFSPDSFGCYLPDESKINRKKELVIEEVNKLGMIGVMNTIRKNHLLTVDDDDRDMTWLFEVKMIELDINTVHLNYSSFVD